jgi:hypothetical protein
MTVYFSFSCHFDTVYPTFKSLFVFVLCLVYPMVYYNMLTDCIFLKVLLWLYKVGTHFFKLTLEKTEGRNQEWQSKHTGNIRYKYHLWFMLTTKYIYITFSIVQTFLYFTIITQFGTNNTCSLSNFPIPSITYNWNRFPSWRM